jgi:hypothetical protein
MGHWISTQQQAGGRHVEKQRKRTKKKKNRERWSSQAAAGRTGVAKFKGEGVALAEDHKSTRSQTQNNTI